MQSSALSRYDWKIAAVLVAFCAGLICMLAREGERRRAAGFVLAWLVPGAGHAFLGRWRKGLFLFALIGGTCLFGLWITGFRAVSFEDNPFYYVGQYGSGATLLLARFISPEKAFPRSDLHPSWFDPGLLYVCVAGLLNLVVTLNVLDLKLSPSGPSPAGAVPSGPAPEKTA
jgi:hypothetical protein